MDRARMHELALIGAAQPHYPALLMLGRFARPLRRVPKLGWLTADREVGQRVLADNRNFTLLDSGGVGDLWRQLFGDWVDELFDGQGHQKLRHSVHGMMHGDHAADLVQQAFSDRLDNLTTALKSGKTVDIAQVGRVLVGRIIARLLRYPVPDQRQINRPSSRFSDYSPVSHGVVSHEDGSHEDKPYLELFHQIRQLASIAVKAAVSGQLSAEQINQAKKVQRGLTGGIAERVREAPPDTLLGQCHELGISSERIEGLITLMMVAATEAASSAMARIVAVLHDTGAQHHLLEDESLIPNAVLEGLRVTSPAAAIGRNARHDVKLAGRSVSAGDRVTVLTYAANNTEGGFDLNRPAPPGSQQLWFGSGRHLCLGADIARVAIGKLLSALTDTGQAWRVVRRVPSRKVVIPGYASLRIRLANRS